MPKFVDKENLPQYKYFHNMLKRDADQKEMVANFITANYIFTGLKKKRDMKQYRESLNMLGKVKKQIPEFLYKKEEDQRRCSKDVNTKNLNILHRKMEKYIDILLVLPFFQGSQMNCQIEVDDAILEKLSKAQKERLYEYEPKDGKYYTKVMSIPKLLLINKDLYQQYLLCELSDSDCNELDRLMTEDVHYIINVQDKSQSEFVYMVVKDKREIYVERLHREIGTQREYLKSFSEMPADTTSVLMSLLDYLQEVERLEKERRKFEEKRDTTTENKHIRKQKYSQKYTDKNSIKVFDMKNEKDELEIFYFSKKYGSGGHYRVRGYEVMPHTRKGHYRKYKNGKTVYVRATIVHKETYKGIQSAHRINETL